jgi:hypothetical protein
MSTPFHVGQRLKARETLKRFGSVILKAGQAVAVERVSPLGNLIVSGHGGYFPASRFEVA